MWCLYLCAVILFFSVLVQWTPVCSKVMSAGSCCPSWVCANPRLWATCALVTLYLLECHIMVSLGLFHAVSIVAKALMWEEIWNGCRQGVLYVKTYQLSGVGTVPDWLQCDYGTCRQKWCSCFRAAVRVKLERLYAGCPVEFWTAWEFCGWAMSWCPRMSVTTWHSDQSSP